MAPPDWAVRLVRAGRGLLFLDELSTAPPAVQAALLRVVLERRVGALQLPPGVRIVAAANPRVLGGRRLGAEPAAGQPVRPSAVDPRPRGRGARAGRDLAPGAAAPARRRSGCRRRWRSPAARCAASCTPGPTLVHRLPSTETRRGGAWPSPRSWEMALRLLAFAHRGGRLPGGAVPAGPGRGGGRAGARAAGQPGPDGPAGPGVAAGRPGVRRPARAGRPAPGGARRRGGGGPGAAGAVPLGRGAGRCWSGRWRPAPRTWWSSRRPRSPRCGATTGRCRRRSSGSPG